MASSLTAHAATIETRIRDSATLDAFFREHYTDPFKEVAVDWEGMDFTPPDGPWMQPRVLWGDGFEDTMATTSSNRIPGVLNLNVFDKPGDGTGRMDELADLLRDLFNRAKLSSDVIRFGVPSGPKPPTTIKGAREGWLKKNLSVPFEVIETA